MNVLLRVTQIKQNKKCPIRGFFYILFFIFYFLYMFYSVEISLKVIFDNK